MRRPCATQAGRDCPHPCMALLSASPQARCSRNATRRKSNAAAWQCVRALAVWATCPPGGQPSRPAWAGRLPSTWSPWIRSLLLSAARGPGLLQDWFVILPHAGRGIRTKATYAVNNLQLSEGGSSGPSCCFVYGRWRQPAAVTAAPTPPAHRRGNCAKEPLLRLAGAAAAASAAAT
jgi:hypothetical protein